MNYRASRGTHEPGEDITDSKEAFEHMFEHEYNNLQALYNNASADDKAAIDGIFGGNIWGAKSEADMWLEMNEEDPATLDAAFEAIKPFVSR